jgi:hypothetical protein
MPEWQGAGVGLRFLCAVAEDWRIGNNRYGKPMLCDITTSHPGLVSALARHAAWRPKAARLLGERTRSEATGSHIRGHYGGHLRATASFRYVGGAA